MEDLLKDIHKHTKISDNEEKWFGIEDIYGVLSKWNPETGEYCTDKDLMTGKKLLSETNGYENYCNKEELKKIAQAEQNLLYLAQTKKLSNATIYTIAMNHPVSEDTLAGLYQCGAFSLKRVETYASQKGMNLNQIKESGSHYLLTCDNLLYKYFFGKHQVYIFPWNYFPHSYSYFITLMKYISIKKE